MGGILGKWVLGLAGAALITCICLMITPEGRVKKVTSLVCGFVLILALIKPLVGFDYTSFSKNYAGLRLDAENLGQPLGDVNEKLERTIIEQECSAYIVDKGTALGILNISAEVTAKWSEDGYWYPVSAAITSGADPGAQSKLNGYIESELGISPSEIVWSDGNEG